MLGRNLLLEYLKKRGVNDVVTFSDGALLKPVRFPLAALETHGAVLFADLPGYSKLASRLEPAECAAVASHFFAWFEGEAAQPFGGVASREVRGGAHVERRAGRRSVWSLGGGSWPPKGGDATGHNPRWALARVPANLGLAPLLPQLDTRRAL